MSLAEELRKLQADWKLTEAMLREQHSADLREVAEMAIASHREYVAKALSWNGGKQPEEPTADSILSAFHERKAKVSTHE